MLNKTHPQHEKISKVFQTQICDNDDQTVWCCRNGEIATDSELKQLNLIGDGTKSNTNNIKYFNIDYNYNSQNIPNYFISKIL